MNIISRAKPESVEDLNVTTGPLPASRKIHVPGTVHPEMQVAMRDRKSVV